MESCDDRSTVKPATEDMRPASGSKDVGNLMFKEKYGCCFVLVSMSERRDGRPSRGPSLTPAPGRVLRTREVFLEVFASVLYCKVDLDLEKSSMSTGGHGSVSAKEVVVSWLSVGAKGLRTGEQSLLGVVDAEASV